MPASVQKPPTVFISYAHESEALASSVATLADWLGSNGCQALTDHVYVHRPPEQGWQVWMSDCIRAADTVLAVHTPGLKAAAGANEEPPVAVEPDRAFGALDEHLSHGQTVVPGQAARRGCAPDSSRVARVALGQTFVGTERARSCIATS